MEANNPVWKKYTKLNMLGSSQFGTAFKAKTKDGTIVTVKEYSRYQKDANEVHQAEINNLKLFKSDYTINSIEEMQTDEYYYIIRNYYWGTLEEFAKVHPKGIPPKEIQKILLDLSNVFKILNEKEYIHKDIKPSNILLSLDGKNGYKAILSGIHLAIKFSDKESSLSSLRGMRYICPPEGLKGEDNNMKYDLWSVGVLIYYMIKGKYPFDGRRDAVVINQIESGINLKISDDAELNDLLEKTLEKDVNKRISWEDFFKHRFLTKEFPGKKKKTNVQNSPEFINLKTDWKKFAYNLNQNSRGIFADLRQYNAIISNLNNDIYNDFNEKIFQILKDINREYTDIINSKIYD